MLSWSQQFSILLFLDSNEYTSKYGSYECLLAVADKASLTATSLPALQELHQQHKEWVFGHLAYEYKNELHHMLSSRHEVKVGVPSCFFFIPTTVCFVDKGRTTLTIETPGSPNDIYNAICNSAVAVDVALPCISWRYTTGKDKYIDDVKKLKEHIINGDCYEINYCTEGYAEDVVIDPLQMYRALDRLSPAPFAAYYRLNDVYMACASPERYLYKKDKRLLAQPIKGTARRDADAMKDKALKVALYNDIKERAENVMIVDLMRNDLARCSQIGSVQVDELFGIYTFPQVHQMISTVSSTLRGDMTFADALRYSFPMGSMTGAPKIKVMQLIDAYEDSSRELYSGSVGYITPDGDMDMNVVIRSLFYNEVTRYLSYHTGGAITADSVPEKEYEEMRLKAWALERIFE